MARLRALLGILLLVAHGSDALQSQTSQSSAVVLSVIQDDVSEGGEMMKLGQAFFEAKVDLSGYGDSRTLARQLCVPVAALVLGLICLRGKGMMNTSGKILVYFGAQTFMNLYMKVVLSNCPVSAQEHMKGFPAAFAVTALQQLASFLLLVIAFGVAWCTPWRYKPRLITTRNELITVLCFSLAFTVNIALNNFSLMLLPISINLIIRSCAPLTTFAAQQIMARLFSEPIRDSNILEIICMIAGVACAGIAVSAKSSPQEESPETAHLLLGLLVCIASLISASLNMALAGVLGSSMSMNPIDTTLYMSLPSFVFLLPPIFLIPHPTGWPGNVMTDFAIVRTVGNFNPAILWLALLSGVFALIYNALQFTIVQSLSATHAAFASNFNKAATIGIAMVVGLETVRMNHEGKVMLVGITGNIAAFTVYSMLKAGGGKKKSVH